MLIQFFNMMFHRAVLDYCKNGLLASIAWLPHFINHRFGSTITARECFLVQM
jgi:hypothetical protein